MPDLDSRLHEFSQQCYAHTCCFARVPNRLKLKSLEVDLAQQFAEGARRGLAIPHVRQFVLDQRVLDDVEHGWDWGFGIGDWGLGE